MIKNMLKRRKESDTYLATVRRHRWSRQIMTEIDKILELSASTVAFIRDIASGQITIETDKILELSSADEN